jgi:hypothetical protein
MKNTLAKYSLTYIIADTSPSELDKILSPTFGIGSGQTSRKKKVFKRKNNRFASITTEKEFKSIFGVSKLAFDYILEKVKGKLPNSILTDQSKLGITLEYLKTYPTFIHLGINYGLSHNEARRVIFQTIPRLVYALQEEINFNNKEKGIFMVDDNVIGLIDGSKIRLRKDTEYQRRFYSQDKHTHCINSIVVCDMNTKILYCAVGFFGIQHDATCVRLSNLEKYIQSNELLLGDSAFRGFSWCLNLDNCEFTHQEKNIFQGIYDSERQRVEHCFGLSKNWKVISNESSFRSKHWRLKWIFFLICCIHNLELRIAQ